MTLVPHHCMLLDGLAGQQWRLLGLSKEGKLRFNLSSLQSSMKIRYQLTCCSRMNFLTVPVGAIPVDATVRVKPIHKSTCLLAGPAQAPSDAQSGMPICSKRARDHEDDDDGRTPRFLLESILPTADEQRAVGAHLRMYGASETRGVIEIDGNMLGRLEHDLGLQAQLLKGSASRCREVVRALCAHTLVLEGFRAAKAGQGWVREQLPAARKLRRRPADGKEAA